MSDTHHLRHAKLNRLSIRKQSSIKNADTPKTCRETATGGSGSPDILNSPSTVRLSASDSPISTPVTSRKRYFSDDSPSQDGGGGDLSPLLAPSQDIYRTDFDVGWKWDEQKSNSEHKKQLSDVGGSHTNRKRLRHFRTPVRHRSPEVRNVAREKRGFYKFREELMKNFATCTTDEQNLAEQTPDNLFAAGHHQENHSEPLNASNQENIFNETTFTELPNEANNDCKEIQKRKLEENRTNNKSAVDVPILEIEKPKDLALTNGLEDWTNDDIDIDKLLTVCSQQVEANLQKLAVPTAQCTKTAPNIKKNSFSNFQADFESANDSFDGLMLEIVDNCVEKNICITSSYPNSSNQMYKTCKNTSFSRFNSMPVTIVPQQSTNFWGLDEKSETASTSKAMIPSSPKSSTSFLRHNSMPNNKNDKKIPTEVPNSSSEFLPSLKSVESDAERKRLISEEIQRKRLEAVERLKARKKKASLSLNRK